jgi:hypothetical protein
MTQKSPGPNVRVPNDLLHDIAAGLFPGAVIAAWIVRGAIDALDPGRGAIVTRASGGLWMLMLLGLAVSTATGVLRLRYWQLNVRSGFLETKKQMAATKHIVFVFVLLLSAWGLAAL